MLQLREVQEQLRAARETAGPTIERLVRSTGSQDLHGCTASKMTRSAGSGAVYRSNISPTSQSVWSLPSWPRQMCCLLHSEVCVLCAGRRVSCGSGAKRHRRRLPATPRSRCGMHTHTADIARAKTWVLLPRFCIGCAVLGPECKPKMNGGLSPHTVLQPQRRKSRPQYNSVSAEATRPQVALSEARQALDASQAEAAGLRDQLRDQARDAAAVGAEAVRAGEQLQECRRELEAVSYITRPSADWAMRLVKPPEPRTVAPTLSMDGHLLELDYAEGLRVAQESTLSDVSNSRLYTFSCATAGPRSGGRGRGVQGANAALGAGGSGRRQPHDRAGAYPFVLARIPDYPCAVGSESHLHAKNPVACDRQWQRLLTCHCRPSPACDVV